MRNFRLILHWPELGWKYKMFHRHASFFVIFALAGTAIPFGIREGNDWGGDFSIYILQARNFAEHRSFYESSYVPTPESLIPQPAVYPPLPSLLLAPVYKTRGLDYRSMKLLLALFLWLSLPLYYRIGCGRGINRNVTAVILLIFILSPLLLGIEQTVGSDFVFLFVSALALLTINEMYRLGSDVRHPVFAGFLTSLLLFLCYLTRATGLALICGFAAYEVWRARRVRAFSLVVAGFTAAFFLLYTRFLFDVRGQYGSQFVLSPQIWVQNAIAYLETPAVLWANAPAILRYPLAAIVLSLAIAGLARRLRHPTLVEFYLAVSLLVLIAYWVNNSRYILPVIPFLLMYAVEALISFRDWLAACYPNGTAHQRFALTAFAVVAIVTSLANIRKAETGPVKEGSSQPSFAELSTFLRLNTPADGLILSWNPRVVALYTGKRSALYPQNSSPANFERTLPAGTVRLLVYHNSDLDRQKLTPFLEFAAAHLVTRFENSDFKVFALPEATKQP